MGLLQRPLGASLNAYWGHRSEHQAGPDLAEPKAHANPWVFQANSGRVQDEFHKGRDESDSVLYEGLFKGFNDFRRILPAFFASFKKWFFLRISCSVFLPSCGYSF